jgi:hypothetical protein
VWNNSQIHQGAWSCWQYASRVFYQVPQLVVLRSVSLNYWNKLSTWNMNKRNMCLLITSFVPLFTYGLLFVSKTCLNYLSCVDVLLLKKFFIMHFSFYSETCNYFWIEIFFWTQDKSVTPKWLCIVCLAAQFAYLVDTMLVCVPYYLQSFQFCLGRERQVCSLTL